MGQGYRLRPGEDRQEERSIARVNSSTRALTRIYGVATGKTLASQSQSRCLLNAATYEPI